MEMVKLAASRRDMQVSAKELRRNKKVPCILYGNETENTPLECDAKDMIQAFTRAGESTLVELDLSGKKIPVLFHAINFHPVTENILHVDFYAVNMKKETEANVPVHLTGEAPAVKNLGGVVVTSHDHVTVRCLPTNLPHALEVDISKLEAFDDAVYVSDIILPAEVKILDEPEIIIASIHEPRHAEEEPVVAEAVPAEGEAAAEGAAPAEAK